MSVTSLKSRKNSSLLFFCEGISYAHIARSSIVAQWLKSLNYPVVVACTKVSSSLFAEKGFETVNIEITDPVDIYRRLRQNGIMYETKDLLKYYRQDRHLIESIQPRLILSEFRFTVLQLAKKYGIPSVGMTEAACHPSFVPDGSVPNPFAKPHFIPLWLLDFIARRTPVGKVINQQTIEYLSIPLQEASIAYKLEPLPTFFDYASQGDICLICDHPDLIPIDPLRPGDLFTGALLWQRPDPLPSEIARLNPDCKTVYVSLGTQESLPTDFLESYIEQLLKHNLQVIVSRGKRSFNLKLTHDRLFVFDFINDSKIFPYVDLLVYPGGAMTTYQALSCGVPLLALPAHANQHFYAEAIARNKLGSFFRPSRLKIEELVKATLSLLNNLEIKNSAKTFEKKLASFDAKEKIVNRIKALIN
jgi:UDP:flavonoid glycosyltransferase YjiC (YdhE family)